MKGSLCVCFAIVVVLLCILFYANSHEQEVSIEQCGNMERYRGGTVWARKDTPELTRKRLRELYGKREHYRDLGNNPFEQPKQKIPECRIDPNDPAKRCVMQERYRDLGNNPFEQPKQKIPECKIDPNDPAKRCVMQQEYYSSMSDGTAVPVDPSFRPPGDENVRRANYSRDSFLKKLGDNDKQVRRPYPAAPPVVRPKGGPLGPPAAMAPPVKERKSAPEPGSLHKSEGFSSWYPALTFYDSVFQQDADRVKDTLGMTLDDYRLENKMMRGQRVLDD